MESNEGGEKTLSQLFDESLRLYNEISKTMEPSTSKSYQDKVATTIISLENATKLVNLLALFSPNETVEEVTTSYLKFFLLPVLLGDLVQKKMEEDRLQQLETAEVYYKDFLKRCRNYELTTITVPDEKEEAESRHPGPMGFIEMAKQRDEKIRQLQEKKQNEEKLQELEERIKKPSTDEEVVREYYILLVTKFIQSALEELRAIAAEKPVVEYMKKMKAGQVPNEVARPKPKKTDLPPVMIITKDVLQKTVYGLGYPSQPVFTVEELMKTRLETGWYGKLTSNVPPGSALQDIAGAEGGYSQPAEEKGAEDKERKEEVDDEESLMKARNWDEWKDDHRRGWGNRDNMG